MDSFNKDVYLSPYQHSASWKQDKGRVSRKFGALRKILECHYDGYNILDSRHLANFIRRYINETLRYHQSTPQFAEEIHGKILLIHDYNCRLAEIKGKYPCSRHLRLCLTRYVELEMEILYQIEYYCKEYEVIVEKRVLSLLQLMMYDILTNNEATVKCDTDGICSSLLKFFSLVMVNLTQAQHNRYKILNKMIDKLVLKIGDLNNIKILGNKCDYGSDDSCSASDSDDQMETSDSGISVNQNNGTVRKRKTQHSRVWPPNCINKNTRKKDVNYLQSETVIDIVDLDDFYSAPRVVTIELSDRGTDQDKIYWGKEVKTSSRSTRSSSYQLDNNKKCNLHESNTANEPVTVILSSDSEDDICEVEIRDSPVDLTQEDSSCMESLVAKSNECFSNSESTSSHMQQTPGLCDNYQIQESLEVALKFHSQGVTAELVKQVVSGTIAKLDEELNCNRAALIPPSTILAESTPVGSSVCGASNDCETNQESDSTEQVLQDFPSAHIITKNHDVPLNPLSTEYMGVLDSSTFSHSSNSSESSLHEEITEKLLEDGTNEIHVSISESTDTHDVLVNPSSTEDMAVSDSSAFSHSSNSPESCLHEKITEEVEEDATNEIHVSISESTETHDVLVNPSSTEDMAVSDSAAFSHSSNSSESYLHEEITEELQEDAINDIHISTSESTETRGIPINPLSTEQICVSDSAAFSQASNSLENCLEEEITEELQEYATNDSNGIHILTSEHLETRAIPVNPLSTEYMCISNSAPFSQSRNSSESCSHEEITEHNDISVSTSESVSSELNIEHNLASGRYKVDCSSTNGEQNLSSTKSDNLHVSSNQMETKVADKTDCSTSEAGTGVSYNENEDNFDHTSQSDHDVAVSQETLDNLDYLKDDNLIRALEREINSIESSIRVSESENSASSFSGSVRDSDSDSKKNGGTWVNYTTQEECPLLLGKNFLNSYTKRCEMSLHGPKKTTLKKTTLKSRKKYFNVLDFPYDAELRLSNVKREKKNDHTRDDHKTKQGGSLQQDIHIDFGRNPDSIIKPHNKRRLTRSSYKTNDSNIAKVKDKKQKKKVTFKETVENIIHLEDHKVSRNKSPRSFNTSKFISIKTLLKTDDFFHESSKQSSHTAECIKKKRGRKPGKKKSQNSKNQKKIEKHSEVRQGNVDSEHEVIKENENSTRNNEDVNFEDNSKHMSTIEVLSTLVFNSSSIKEALEISDTQFSGEELTIVSESDNDVHEENTDCIDEESSGLDNTDTTITTTSNDDSLCISPTSDLLQKNKPPDKQNNMHLVPDDFLDPYNAMCKNNQIQPNFEGVAKEVELEHELIEAPQKQLRKTRSLSFLMNYNAMLETVNESLQQKKMEDSILKSDEQFVNREHFNKKVENLSLRCDSFKNIAHVTDRTNGNFNLTQTQTIEETTDLLDKHTENTEEITDSEEKSTISSPLCRKTSEDYISDFSPKTEVLDSKGDEYSNPLIEDDTIHQTGIAQQEESSLDISCNIEHTIEDVNEEIYHTKQNEVNLEMAMNEEAPITSDVIITIDKSNSIPLKVSEVSSTSDIHCNNLNYQRTLNEESKDSYIEVNSTSLQISDMLTVCSDNNLIEKDNTVKSFSDGNSDNECHSDISSTSTVVVKTSSGDQSDADEHNLSIDTSSKNLSKLQEEQLLSTCSCQIECSADNSNEATKNSLVQCQTDTPDSNPTNVPVDNLGIQFHTDSPNKSMTILENADDHVCSNIYEPVCQDSNIDSSNLCVTEELETSILQDGDDTQIPLQIPEAHLNRQLSSFSGIDVESGALSESFNSESTNLLSLGESDSNKVENSIQQSSKIYHSNTLDNDTNSENQKVPCTKTCLENITALEESINVYNDEFIEEVVIVDTLIHTFAEDGLSECTTLIETCESEIVKNNIEMNKLKITEDEVFEGNSGSEACKNLISKTSNGINLSGCESAENRVNKISDGDLTSEEPEILHITETNNEMNILCSESPKDKVSENVDIRENQKLQITESNAEIDMGQHSGLENEVPEVNVTVERTENVPITETVLTIDMLMPNCNKGEVSDDNITNETPENLSINEANQEVNPAEDELSDNSKIAVEKSSYIDISKDDEISIGKDERSKDNLASNDNEIPLDYSKESFRRSDEHDDLSVEVHYNNLPSSDKKNNDNNIIVDVSNDREKQDSYTQECSCMENGKVGHDTFFDEQHSVDVIECSIDGNIDEAIDLSQVDSGIDTLKSHIFTETDSVVEVSSSNATLFKTSTIYVGKIHELGYEDALASSLEKVNFVDAIVSGLSNIENQQDILLSSACINISKDIVDTLAHKDEESNNKMLEPSLAVESPTVSVTELGNARVPVAKQQSSSSDYIQKQSTTKKLLAKYSSSIQEKNEASNKKSEGKNLLDENIDQRHTEIEADVKKLAENVTVINNNQLNKMKFNENKSDALRVIKPPKKDKSKLIDLAKATNEFMNDFIPEQRIYQNKEELTNLIPVKDEPKKKTNSSEVSKTLQDNSSKQVVNIHVIKSPKTEKKMNHKKNKEVSDASFKKNDSISLDNSASLNHSLITDLQGKSKIKQRSSRLNSGESVTLKHNKRETSIDKIMKAEDIESSKDKNSLKSRLRSSDSRGRSVERKTNRRFGTLKKKQISPDEFGSNSSNLEVIELSESKHKSEVLKTDVYQFTDDSDQSISDPLDSLGKLRRSKSESNGSSRSSEKNHRRTRSSTLQPYVLLEHCNIKTRHKHKSVEQIAKKELISNKNDESEHVEIDNSKFYEPETNERIQYISDKLGRTYCRIYRSRSKSDDSKEGQKKQNEHKKIYETKTKSGRQQSISKNQDFITVSEESVVQKTSEGGKRKNHIISSRRNTRFSHHFDSLEESIKTETFEVGFEKDKPKEKVESSQCKSKQGNVESHKLQKKCVSKENTLCLSKVNIAKIDKEVEEKGSTEIHSNDDLKQKGLTGGFGEVKTRRRKISKDELHLNSISADGIHDMKNETKKCNKELHPSTNVIESETRQLSKLVEMELDKNQSDELLSRSNIKKTDKHEKSVDESDSKLKRAEKIFEHKETTEENEALVDKRKVKDKKFNKPKQNQEKIINNINSEKRRSTNNHIMKENEMEATKRKDEDLDELDRLKLIQDNPSDPIKPDKKRTKSNPSMKENDMVDEKIGKDTDELDKFAPPQEIITNAKKSKKKTSKYKHTTKSNEAADEHKVHISDLVHENLTGINKSKKERFVNNPTVEENETVDNKMNDKDASKLDKFELVQEHLIDEMKPKKIKAKGGQTSKKNEIVFERKYKIVDELMNFESVTENLSYAVKSKKNRLKNYQNKKEHEAVDDGIKYKALDKSDLVEENITDTMEPEKDISKNNQTAKENETVRYETNDKDTDKLETFDLVQENLRDKMKPKKINSKDNQPAKVNDILNLERKYKVVDELDNFESVTENLTDLIEPEKNRSKNDQNKKEHEDVYDRIKYKDLGKSELIDENITDTMKSEKEISKNNKNAKEHETIDNKTNDKNTNELGRVELVQENSTNEMFLRNIKSKDNETVKENKVIDPEIKNKGMDELDKFEPVTENLTDLIKPKKNRFKNYQNKKKHEAVANKIINKDLDKSELIEENITDTLKPEKEICKSIQIAKENETVDDKTNDKDKLDRFELVQENLTNTMRPKKIQSKGNQTVEKNKIIGLERKDEGMDELDKFVPATENLTDLSKPKKNRSKSYQNKNECEHVDDKMKNKDLDESELIQENIKDPMIPEMEISKNNQTEKENEQVDNQTNDRDMDKLDRFELMQENLTDKMKPKTMKSEGNLTAKKDEIVDLERKDINMDELDKYEPVTERNLTGLIKPEKSISKDYQNNTEHDAVHEKITYEDLHKSELFQENITDTMKPEKKISKNNQTSKENETVRYKINDKDMDKLDRFEVVRKNLTEKNKQEMLKPKDNQTEFIDLERKDRGKYIIRPKNNKCESDLNIKENKAVGDKINYKDLNKFELVTENLTDIIEPKKNRSKDEQNKKDHEAIDDKMNCKDLDKSELIKESITVTLKPEKEISRNNQTSKENETLCNNDKDTDKIDRPKVVQENSGNKMKPKKIKSKYNQTAKKNEIVDLERKDKCMGGLDIYEPVTDSLTDIIKQKKNRPKSDQKVKAHEAVDYKIKYKDLDESELIQGNITHIIEPENRNSKNDQIERVNYIVDKKKGKQLETLDKPELNHENLTDRLKLKKMTSENDQIPETNYVLDDKGNNNNMDKVIESEIAQENITDAIEPEKKSSEKHKTEKERAVDKKRKVEDMNELDRSELVQENLTHAVKQKNKKFKDNQTTKENPSVDRKKNDIQMNEINKSDLAQEVLMNIIKSEKNILSDPHSKENTPVDFTKDTNSKPSLNQEKFTDNSGIAEVIDDKGNHKTMNSSTVGNTIQENDPQCNKKVIVLKHSISSILEKETKLSKAEETAPRTARIDNNYQKKLRSFTSQQSMAQQGSNSIQHFQSKNNKVAEQNVGIDSIAYKVVKNKIECLKIVEDTISEKICLNSLQSNKTCGGEIILEKHIDIEGFKCDVAAKTPEESASLEKNGKVQLKKNEINVISNCEISNNKPSHQVILDASPDVKVQKCFDIKNSETCSGVMLNDENDSNLLQITPERKEKTTEPRVRERNRDQKRKHASNEDSFPDERCKKFKTDLTDTKPSNTVKANRNCSESKEIHKINKIEETIERVKKSLVQQNIQLAEMIVQENPDVPEIAQETSFSENPKSNQSNSIVGIEDFGFNNECNLSDQPLIIQSPETIEEIVTDSGWQNDPLSEQTIYFDIINPDDLICGNFIVPTREINSETNGILSSFDNSISTSHGIMCPMPPDGSGDLDSVNTCVTSAPSPECNMQGSDTVQNTSSVSDTSDPNIGGPMMGLPLEKNILVGNSEERSLTESSNDDTLNYVSFNPNFEYETEYAISRLLSVSQNNTDCIDFSKFIDTSNESNEDNNSENSQDDSSCELKTPERMTFSSNQPIEKFEQKVIVQKVEEYPLMKNEGNLMNHHRLEPDICQNSKSVPSKVVSQGKIIPSKNRNSKELIEKITFPMCRIPSRKHNRTRVVAPPKKKPVDPQSTKPDDKTTSSSKEEAKMSPSCTSLPKVTEKCDLWKTAAERKAFDTSTSANCDKVKQPNKSAQKMRIQPDGKSNSYDSRPSNTDKNIDSNDFSGGAFDRVKLNKRSCANNVTYSIPQSPEHKHSRTKRKPTEVKQKEKQTEPPRRTREDRAVDLPGSSSQGRHVRTRQEELKRQIEETDETENTKRMKPNEKDTNALFDELRRQGNVNKALNTNKLCRENGSHSSQYYNEHGSSRYPRRHNMTNYSDQNGPTRKRDSMSDYGPHTHQYSHQRSSGNSSSHSTSIQERRPSLDYRRDRSTYKYSSSCHERSHRSSYRLEESYRSSQHNSARNGQTFQNEGGMDWMKNIEKYTGPPPNLFPAPRKSNG